MRTKDAIIEELFALLDGVCYNGALDEEEETALEELRTEYSIICQTEK